MNRKLYNVEDFNEWTIVHKSGIMNIPSSPSVSDWLESEAIAGRMKEKYYDFRGQFRMYDHHSNYLFRFPRPDSDRQIDICSFCGRFEPCENSWGNMFCVDTNTCMMFRMMEAGRYKLTYNLTPEYQWTLDLLKKCNLARLPNRWKAWAENQLSNELYRKGEL